MPSSHESLLCQYRYDALDRLIGHEPTGSPQSQRFYCKSRLATEIQGTLQQSIVQYGDWLLAQQQRQGDVLDATLLSTDQQRSLLHTVKANHLTHSFAYSPYGHHRAESGLLSLLGFNGERPDPVTGNHLLGNGYRAFSPVLMRFNSPDSLSPFEKGGLNSYGYCQGDPVNKSDPTGHLPQIILKALAALGSKHAARSISRSAFEKSMQLYRKNITLNKSLQMPVMEQDYLSAKNITPRNPLTNLQDILAKSIPEKLLHNTPSHFPKKISNIAIARSKEVDHLELAPLFNYLHNKGDRASYTLKFELTEIYAANPGVKPEKIDAYANKILAIRNPNEKEYKSKMRKLDKDHFRYYDRGWW